MEQSKQAERPQTLGSCFIDENGRISDENLIDYAYKLSKIFKKIGIFAKDPTLAFDIQEKVAFALLNSPPYPTESPSAREIAYVDFEELEYETIAREDISTLDTSQKSQLQA